MISCGLMGLCLDAHNMEKTLAQTTKYQAMLLSAKELDHKTKYNVFN